MRCPGWSAQSGTIRGTSEDVFFAGGGQAGVERRGLGGGENCVEC